MIKKENKDLAYWKANAEEDYMRVPISVLRYIAELEMVVKNCNTPAVMPAVCVGCVTSEHRNEWLEPCHSCSNGSNKQTEA